MLALFRVARLVARAVPKKLLKTGERIMKRLFVAVAATLLLVLSRLFWPIGCVRPVFADQRVNAGGIPWRLQPKRFDIGLAADLTA